MRAKIFKHTGLVLRAVRTRAGLVTRIATDVRNGVGLAKTRVSGGGIEAGVRLDVDKHAGGP